MTQRDGAPGVVRELARFAPGAEPVVSAIVSVYNCERFIRGCLDDLLAQTLGPRLEIVTVISGTEQGEAAIIDACRAAHGNISVLRTGRRESIYAAWTRGCKAARGRYLTNANADDRHRPDALERMAAALDAHPGAALVYANSLITATPNQPFDQATPIGRTDWPAFDRKALFTYNYIGPQPMWRASLHARHGWFDRDFQVAGDYEFWLRVARTEDFLLLPEVLGLYYLAPDTAERRDKTLARNETLAARRRYAPPR
jgi:glycosyltransferase involved in cell wall biosynthesis